ncbi:hypothetical protein DM02DRAFT_634582 [Periconia macrospinosa]|uniref:Uncharacterized protein n=1 Tax=Periconia macrospinosa TaxID=97972 RepID=A0A2V1D5Q2_9PLEO|nr:hypothetical protein DM02DRAFT_634582 [Periconia macrospinosa]
MESYDEEPGNPSWKFVLSGRVGVMLYVGETIQNARTPADAISHRVAVDVEVDVAHALLRVWISVSNVEGTSHQVAASPPVLCQPSPRLLVRAVEWRINLICWIGGLEFRTDMRTHNMGTNEHDDASGFLIVFSLHGCSSFPHVLPWYGRSETSMHMDE